MDFVCIATLRVIIIVIVAIVIYCCQYFYLVLLLLLLLLFIEPQIYGEFRVQGSITHMQQTRTTVILGDLGGVYLR